MAEKKKIRKKKSILPKIFMILFFMIGLGIFMYPILSNLYANFYHTRVIDTYKDTVNKKSKNEKSELIKNMIQYNKEMATGDGVIQDPYSKPDTKKKNKKTQHKVLDALEKKLGEVLGYITIPEIDVKLPLYNGASEYQLQKGAGVLPGTSLPIGGEGTHSVITGHRGLPSAKLFSDLPKLKKGDKFFIDILGETHEYQIDQIKTVLPEDISDLQLVPGKDYITLLTCTPYMINTHRLLVRGVRVPMKEKDKEEDTVKYCNCIIPLIVLIVICFLILILLWRIYRIMKREEKRRQEEQEQKEKEERKKRIERKKKQKREVETKDI